MSKKKQIETHAKVDGPPTNLEQVFGFNEYAKYGTLDESVYVKRLNEMNRSDLEAHARKMGLIIVESSERLRGKLLQEFRNYVTYLHKPVQPVQQQPQKISEEARKVLAEGR